MTNLRALITQLADELDHNRQCLLDDRRLMHPLAEKARAALAEIDGSAASADREPTPIAQQTSDKWTGFSSPAQAVLDAAFAVEDEWCTIPMIAAALRAAADQVPYLPKNCSSYDINVQDGREEVRSFLLTIATELEAS